MLFFSTYNCVCLLKGVCAAAGVQVIDSPLLTQQIEAQRLSIKYLKNENNRLKVSSYSDRSTYLY